MSARRSSKSVKPIDIELEPDASPDTASPLALAVHDQRVTVGYACRAGNIGMGGESEHRHQGGGRGERHDQGNGKVPAHGGMLSLRPGQTKMRMATEPPNVAFCDPTGG